MSLIALAIVLIVAAFDTVVGVRLLFGARPFSINGAGTLWAVRGAALWQGDDRTLLHSLYQRLGAFSFHTGVVTAIFALASRWYPPLLTVLLVTYTVTGLAFFANDRRYFKGTRYFVVKQALGALWTVALVLQLVG